MSYISGSGFVELPYTVGSGSLELPYISGSWSGSVELPFISGFKSVELPYISGSGFMDSNIIGPGSLNFRKLVDSDPGSRNNVFLTHWLLAEEEEEIREGEDQEDEESLWRYPRSYQVKNSWVYFSSSSWGRGDRLIFLKSSAYKGVVILENVCPRGFTNIS